MELGRGRRALGKLLIDKSFLLHFCKKEALLAFTVCLGYTPPLIRATGLCGHARPQ
jgi:hypothetical protein